jgi:hypothetical protein
MALDHGVGCYDKIRLLPPVRLIGFGRVSGLVSERGFGRGLFLVSWMGHIIGMPMSRHISARPDDFRALINGLIEAYELLCKDDFDAVLMAAIIAFGFVFIHPFEDGNGCIHDCNRARIFALSCLVLRATLTLFKVSRSSILCTKAIIIPISSGKLRAMPISMPSLRP